MFAKHKDKILKYLRAGEEIAHAAGFVCDIINVEYMSIERASYADKIALELERIYDRAIYE